MLFFRRIKKAMKAAVDAFMYPDGVGHEAGQSFPHMKPYTTFVQDPSNNQALLARYVTNRGTFLLGSGDDMTAKPSKVFDLGDAMADLQQECLDEQATEHEQRIERLKQESIDEKKELQDKLDLETKKRKFYEDLADSTSSGATSMVQHQAKKLRTMDHSANTVQSYLEPMKELVRTGNFADLNSQLDNIDRELAENRRKIEAEDTRFEGEQAARQGLQSRLDNTRAEIRADERRLGI